MSGKVVEIKPPQKTMVDRKIAAARAISHLGYAVEALSRDEGEIPEIDELIFLFGVASRKLRFKYLEKRDSE